MTAFTSPFRQYLTHYVSSFQQYLSSSKPDELKVDLQYIPRNLIKDLCNQVRIKVTDEPSVIQISSPVIVIGDIHGHILDLIRILKTFNYPTRFKFLFLGDLVDRGPFSIETILIVFMLKVLYPNNVYFIRGNHEFNEMCSEQGFFANIMEIYTDDSIYHDILSIFAHFPVAALINKKILCVHGGIYPGLSDWKQLYSIPKPLIDFPSDSSSGVFWGDPVENLNGFETSHRGFGYYFGLDVLNKFLLENNLDVLVRGHEVVQDGCTIQLEGKCLTVFSASNYCGSTMNRSGVLKIEGNNREFVRFEPTFYLQRDDVRMVQKPMRRLSIGKETKSIFPLQDQPKLKKAFSSPKVNMNRPIKRSVSTPKSKQRTLVTQNLQTKACKEYNRKININCTPRYPFYKFNYK